MARIIEEWLNSCSGCEIAILNIGDVLVDLLPSLQFVHIPVLIDKKYYGQTGEGKTLEIPEADVAIVSGGVKNEEHLEVLEMCRKRANILVALGTCATDGGIPALGNMYGNQAIRDFSYRESPTTVPGPDPDTETYHIPAMLENCGALDDHVKVDIKLPGCPPHPDWIAAAVLALLDGKPENLKLPERSVCDTCPTIRERKKGGELKRMLQTPEFDPEKPVSEMRCLLEQGFMCLGPVTRAGCSGLKGEAPRCISTRMPCRGCYGPIKEDSKPLMDYVGALASVGYDPARMLDRKGFLCRFNGAHGVLHAVKQPKQK
ncbi:NADH ubiquinone oxidoreductase 20 kDa subunit [Desulfovibrio sp. X2]|uniref:NADH-quinone oxidoreductase subunit B family protein n=1 Tax=Desulfovibrio sp. X2 TaxID=941449 RepID=UPI0003587222|nr:NADH ubiquinone dehydrogenase [Desulfovibrio sp. X2]EPR36341.1 NADH ubiquinone oxidoreductase 20 kDa subunit [Desulfovibrio sp. X2]